MDQFSIRAAKVLDSRREGMNISRRKLAEQTGIPYATLDRRLHDAAKMNLAELEALAKAFRCTATEIVAAAEEVQALAAREDVA